MSPSQPSPPPEQEGALRARLARLEQQQAWATNKETLKLAQRNAAEVRWRLGLISDEDYAALDDFSDGFEFEA